MDKPLITEAGKHVILTYELQSIAGLCRATEQVYTILKTIARREEFFAIKKSTTIKIDKTQGTDKSLRMHFIIPAHSVNRAVLEAILEETPLSEEKMPA